MNRSCRHARGRLLLAGALTVGCAVGVAACQFPGAAPVATGTMVTSPSAAPEDGTAPEAPGAPPSSTTASSTTARSTTGTTIIAGTTTSDSADGEESPGTATSRGPSEPGEPTATTLLSGGAAEGAEAPSRAADPDALPAVTARAAWGAVDTTAEASLVSGRLQAFLAAVDEANATGTTDRTAVRDLSQGSARAEIENSLVEMELEGYRQRGETKVRAVSVHRMNAPVQRLVVVCVDDSEVEIVADNGYVVRPTSSTPRASLHEYTMLRVARDWRVLKHDMPDDPDCGLDR